MSSLFRYLIDIEAGGASINESGDWYDADEVDTQITALEARIEELESALTPSPDTKYFHIGEHKMEVEMIDEDGDDYLEDVVVSWTVIKEIMKSIYDYAENLSYKRKKAAEALKENGGKEG